MRTLPFNEVFAMLVREIGRERAAEICGVSLKCVTNWGKGKTVPNEATQVGAIALLLTVSDFEEEDYQYLHSQRFLETCVKNATKC